MKRLLKTWILPISIAIGIAGYLVYVSIPSLDFTHHAVAEFVNWANPALLFCMLLLSFCKVNFGDIKVRRWMLIMLLVQVVGCVLFLVPLLLFPHSSLRLLFEGGVLMFVCPTATAAVVVSYKLGGKIENVIAYTIVSNIAASVLFPLVISLITVQSFSALVLSFLKILLHVFPVLILPMITAAFLRRFFPRCHSYLARNTEVAFYIWAVTLVFCMGISTKALLESDISWQMLVALSFVVLFCFDMQFRIGHRIGKKHRDRVSGGQTLGQKNTSFAIWLAYTFMTPVTALASSIYIIYQNCFNSWQLYKQEKERHDC
ncbi:MAG: transporter [Prevotella sp.]|nr:transporter [Candidatus Equicola faecalis]MDO4820358.1 transporter [Prevotella sp.]